MATTSDASRPLAGVRVLVTRSREQVGGLAELLVRAGARSLEIPTIQLAQPENWDEVDRAIGDLSSYDWIVFTSANGVQFFFDRLAVVGRDVQALGRSRVAAIGPATADALRQRGAEVAFVPDEYVAEAVAAGLVEGGVVDARVLVARALEAREELVVILRQEGAYVDDLAVYRTLPVQDVGPRLRRQLADGEIDAATFTSSSTVRNLVHLLGDDATDLLTSLIVACIGPITARTARDLGLRVDVVPEEYTIPGLVHALEQHYRRRQTGKQPRLKERQMTGYPAVRPRRLRRTDTLRRLVRETTLAPNDFIYPLFVVHGHGVRDEISSMPGNYHLSPDMLAAEAEQLRSLGIPGVILFGLPADKDDAGSEAYADDGIVQQAVRALKRAAPELLVITDVCLCEYTSHGHCGLLRGQEVDNDPTLELLARTSISHVAAGADIVAPSDMMDGRVAAIRRGLDDAGFAQTAILAYAAKYASAFYGPFRAAADSAPQFGDRRGYQMDPANVREALREVGLDVEEGADMVMVKPALAYLDVVARVRDRFDLPLVAYNVSGEYSMVKAAARNDWIDGRRIALEILTAIKRAGADVIITYHAKEAARWLCE